MNDTNNSKGPSKEPWDLNWYLRYPIAIFILIITLFSFDWIQEYFSNTQQWAPWVISGFLVIFALSIAYEAGCLILVALLAWAAYLALQSLGYLVPETISTPISAWLKQYSWLFIVIYFIYIEHQRTKQHEEQNTRINRLYERISNLEQQNKRNLD